MILSPALFSAVRRRAPRGPVFPMYSTLCKLEIEWFCISVLTNLRIDEQSETFWSHKPCGGEEICRMIILKGKGASLEFFPWRMSELVHTFILTLHTLDNLGVIKAKSFSSKVPFCFSVWTEIQFRNHPQKKKKRERK